MDEETHRPCDSTVQTDESARGTTGGTVEVVEKMSETEKGREKDE